MEWKKLGDLCSITSSKRVFASQYESSGIPFYRSKEIIERRENKAISEPLFISKEVYSNFKRKFGVPEYGDILLTSVGTLGIPYFVKSNDEFYFKDGNLTWMRNFDKNLDSKYLYFWLSSSFGKSSLLQKAIGSSQPALTIEILKKYKIAAPSLPTQRKIASILSAYDSLIENNTKRIRLLEQMAENLYKEWFVRFRFPGHEKVEMENGLPKGWKIFMLSEVIIENPKSKIQVSQADNSGNIPFYTSGKNVLSHNSYLVDGSNIMLNTGGIADVKLNIGKAHYSTDTWCIRGKSNMTYYVYLYLNHIKEEIQSCYFEGAALKHLKKKAFKKKQLLVPDKETLDLFNSLIGNIYNLIPHIKALNDKLSRQRDLLLPRLMSGKLEVNP